MSGPVEILLIIAVVGFVLVRRFLGEAAEGKRMLLLPAILTAVGLSDVDGVAKSPTVLVFFAGTVAASVLFGALRGASVRVEDRGGVVHLRYTAVTLLLWVLNLAVKFGGNLLLGALDPQDSGALGSTLMVTLGAGLLVEGVVSMARAMRTGPVVWAKGANGAPHRTSPLLDDLQHRLTAGRGRR